MAKKTVTRKSSTLSKIDLQSVGAQIENFNKRWSIQLSDEDRWRSFKSRVLNEYVKVVGRRIEASTDAKDEFFELMGMHYTPPISDMMMSLDYEVNFAKCNAYNFFSKEKNIKQFILGLEMIFKMETLKFDDRYEFHGAIQDIIIATGVPLEITDVTDEVLFYPAGAKLLDEKLVNDNLDWLSAYPDSYTSFKAALMEVGVKGKERHVVDNLRLSLEALLKQMMKNGKGLENQKEALGKYLKDRNTNAEITNLFQTVLAYYNKYQNENAKHGDKVQANEVEFILYLTGTLMRFLLVK